MSGHAGRWSAPKSGLSRLDIAFGAIAGLLPAWSEIPEEFRDRQSKWVEFQQAWFFSGIDASGLKPKPGINKTDALGHLQAIQSSFEPKHEHKQAGVAYLASLWFEDDSTWASKAERAK